MKLGIKEEEKRRCEICEIGSRRWEKESEMWSIWDERAERWIEDVWRELCREKSESKVEKWEKSVLEREWGEKRLTEVASAVKIKPLPRKRLKRSWQWEYCSSSVLSSLLFLVSRLYDRPPFCLSQCESVSCSHLCNCGATRCLQSRIVDGLITGLALGLLRHFHAFWLPHNSISLASFCVSHLPASILSHLPYIALNSPSAPLSSFLCLVNGEAHRCCCCKLYLSSAALCRSVPFAFPSLPALLCV